MSAQQLRIPRVLFVTGGALDYGGIAAFMLNYMSHIDPAKAHIDVLVHGAAQGEREAEARALGAEIIHVPFKSEDAAGNLRGIRAALAAGRYDAVHAHMDAMNAYVLKLAKDAGVPIRISHCHSAMHLTESRAKRMLHGLVAKTIPLYATQLFACSEETARFFYGERLVRAGRTRVIPNAFDTERFAWSAALRAAGRAELSLAEDRRVLLHVGGLNAMKNQAFLLDAFALLHARMPESVLVLVGDGPDRAMLAQRIAALSLTECVLPAGRKRALSALYAAADAFAFPSLYEGLGIALLEAQCSGLPCVVSDRVPTEARVLPDVETLPPDSAARWADALEAALRENAPRAGAQRLIAARGYDINEQAARLTDFYRAALGE